MAENDEGREETPHEDGGEPAHLPTPTIFPVGFALGVAVLLIGLVVNWWIVAIGAGIALVFGFLWVRDATSSYRTRPAPPPPARVEDEEEEAEAEGPERIRRSVFLERTTLLLGGLIGAAITVPVVGFAIAPAFIGQGEEDVDIGPLKNYPEGQWVVTTFQSLKGQGSVSRQTAFVRSNGIANKVPSFTILSNHCVHLGCPIQPNGITDTKNPKTVMTGSGDVTLIDTKPAGFGCPCHGGQYDLEGNRTAGPPVRSLDRYEYKIVNGKLVLSGRYSVGEVIGTGADAKIVAYKRFDPGEHVNGWEAWLYPLSPHQ